MSQGSEARRALADKLADMARGSRDLAAEADAVAARFRPEFDGLQDEKGNFPDEAASRRALQIYRFVFDNERAVRVWSDEAETLEAAAAALRDPTLEPANAGAEAFGIPDEAPDAAMDIVDAIEAALDEGALSFAPNGKPCLTWTGRQALGHIIDGALATPERAQGAPGDGA